jgi:signal transduction histidine kinase
MSTAATTPIPGRQRPTLLHRIAGPLAEARTYRELLYVALTIPLGTLWFTILVTGWSLALSFIVFIVGLPILIAVLVVSEWCATAERTVGRSLLRVRLSPIAPIPPRTGIIARLRARLGAGRTWREQVYLQGRFLIGLPAATLVLSVLGSGLALIFAPLIVLAGGDAWWDGFLDTPVKALIAVPVGIVALIAGGWMVRGFAIASARALQWTLAPGRREAGDTPPPELTPSEATAETRDGLARSLPLQGAIAGVITATCVLIWALTGGTFWPVWILLGFGLIIGVQAGTYLALGIADVEVRWLAIHGIFSAAIIILLVSLWAGTASPTFWPVWPMIGLGAVFGIHASIVFARRRTGAAERARLQRRVEELTATRAGAVDAEATELQRIERDLHDGAQARLVSLSMSLGLAEERLADDPEKARELLAGARVDAKQAIAELRDLARGIAPPVLLDRGLEAAVTTLAGKSPIPITVDADLDTRPRHVVERAAYFTVSEAVANAVKHSGATAVRVEIARTDDQLAVTVTDNGQGGADPDGSGLTGLRRRLAAIDGTLAVESNPRTGTRLTARIPWGE